MPYTDMDDYGLLGQLVHDISGSDTSFVMLTTQFRKDMIYEICGPDAPGGETYCTAVLRDSDGRFEEVRTYDHLEGLYAFSTHGGTQVLQRVTMTRSSGLVFRTGATLAATCIKPKAPMVHKVSSIFLNVDPTNERLVFVRSGECATQWYVPPIPDEPHGPVAYPCAPDGDHDTDSERSV